METTSKPKVTIPLVAAIPINLFHCKVDTSAKTNSKSNRTQPYSGRERRVCSSCNNQTHNQTTGEQTAATNIKISNMNMYNASTSMLILPFVSTKPSQIQQKTLPNLYSQHPLSVYHAKKSEDLSSRVI